MAFSAGGAARGAAAPSHGLSEDVNYHKYSADELAAYVGHRTCFTVGVGNRPQSWQQEIKGNVHGVNGPNGSNGSNMRSPGPVERPSGGDWEYLLAEGAKVMTDRDTLAGQVQHMEYMREHELRQSERLVRQVRFLERHVNQLERAVKVTKRWEDKVEMTVGGALTKVQYNGLRLHFTLRRTFMIVMYSVWLSYCVRRHSPIHTHTLTRLHLTLCLSVFVFFRTTKALTPTNKQLEERKKKKLQTTQAAKAAQAAQSALAAAHVAQAAQAARTEQAVRNVQAERAAAVRLKRVETNCPRTPCFLCLVVKLRPLARPSCGVPRGEGASGLAFLLHVATVVMQDQIQPFSHGQCTCLTHTHALFLYFSPGVPPSHRLCFAIIIVPALIVAALLCCVVASKDIGGYQWYQ